MTDKRIPEAGRCEIRYGEAFHWLRFPGISIGHNWTRVILCETGAGISPDILPSWRRALLPKLFTDSSCTLNSNTREARLGSGSGLSGSRRGGLRAAGSVTGSYMELLQESAGGVAWALLVETAVAAMVTAARGGAAVLSGDGGVRCAARADQRALPDNMAASAHSSLRTTATDASCTTDTANQDLVTRTANFENRIPLHPLPSTAKSLRDFIIIINISCIRSLGNIVAV